MAVTDADGCPICCGGAVLTVHKWDEYQHYGKSRSPVWIKVYIRLLEKLEFERLDDASKWHLVGLWLLAARLGNRVPADPEWISRKLAATQPVRILYLYDQGFIHFEARGGGNLVPCDMCRRLEAQRTESAHAAQTTQLGMFASEVLAGGGKPASKVLAPRARKEEKRREKKKTSKSGGSSTDLSDIQVVFERWQNIRAAAIGKSGGPAMKLSDKRAARIRARLAEGYRSDDLILAVEGCLKSRFHREGGHTDIELICRDQAHVERFMLWGRNGAPDPEDRGADDQQRADRQAVARHRDDEAQRQEAAQVVELEADRLKAAHGVMSGLAPKVRKEIQTVAIERLRVQLGTRAPRVISKKLSMAYAVLVLQERGLIE